VTVQIFTVQVSKGNCIKALQNVVEIFNCISSSAAKQTRLLLGYTKSQHTLHNRPKYLHCWTRFFGSSASYRLASAPALASRDEISWRVSVNLGLRRMISGSVNTDDAL